MTSIYSTSSLPFISTSRNDAAAVFSAFGNLEATATSYRESLATVAERSSSFASALEECARLRGSGPSSDGLLAAAGLEYLISNHHRVLADSIYRGFEKPFQTDFLEFRRALDKSKAEYLANLKDRTEKLRLAELEHLRLSRKSTRDLNVFRSVLRDLTSQVDRLDTLRIEYSEEASKITSEASEKLMTRAAYVARAQLEIFEAIARKGWSGGGLDALLESSLDPFAPEDIQSQQDGRGVFSPELYSILPARAILPGIHPPMLSSSSKRSQSHLHTSTNADDIPECDEDGEEQDDYHLDHNNHSNNSTSTIFRNGGHSSHSGDEGERDEQENQGDTDTLEAVEIGSRSHHTSPAKHHHQYNSSYDSLGQPPIYTDTSYYSPLQDFVEHQQEINEIIDNDQTEDDTTVADGVTETIDREPNGLDSERKEAENTTVNGLSPTNSHEKEATQEKASFGTGIS